ncbi:hypothetical protein MVEN_02611400 [Mycena venus]|uniref:GH18 domain-containing protein n=1 Tax=Mycena venus TaxID=2733690 RepID=A0A8H6U137_9AGAR|nr:hypothetical protein MVEN_02611400 [Mycena venus]
MPFERLVGRYLLRLGLPNLGVPAVLSSDFVEPLPTSVATAAKVILGPRSNLPAMSMKPRPLDDGSGTTRDGPCTAHAWRSLPRRSQTDDVAAVNYAVFGSDLNEWVSYDDVTTFGEKMTYANDHCIGGTMIWSMDQDDDIFSAGEILVAMDIIGANLNEQCSSGTTVLCCDGGVTVAPADCMFTDCSSDPQNNCPSSAPNFQTSVGQGLDTCVDGKAESFCCAKPFPYTNCAWQGTPPLRGDNSCQIGQMTVLQDPLGDGTSPCTGGNLRSYCCDVPQPLPAPFSDIFPSTVKDTGNDLFNVDFDPDEGDSFSEEGTTSTFTEDDNENNSAFGEVFIDSPNPSSVLSLHITAGWVLSGCNAKSDQPQTVVAHCSANSDSCQHVFIGGAANTIVKLPLSCGLGPYARVASLEPHSNQSVLARYRRTASGTVYSLSFDYNFAAIPAENGPVYMRADVTDMPDYWDSVVD